MLKLKLKLLSLPGIVAWMAPLISQAFFSPITLSGPNQHPVVMFQFKATGPVSQHTPTLSLSGIFLGRGMFLTVNHTLEHSEIINSPQTFSSVVISVAQPTGQILQPAHVIQIHVQCRVVGHSSREKMDLTLIYCPQVDRAPEAHENWALPEPPTGIVTRGINSLFNRQSLFPLKIFRFASIKAQIDPASRRSDRDLGVVADVIYQIEPVVGRTDARTGNALTTRARVLAADFQQSASEKGNCFEGGTSGSPILTQLKQSRYLAGLLVGESVSDNCRVQFIESTTILQFLGKIALSLPSSFQSQQQHLFRLIVDGHRAF